jgi:bile acid-coenzyme A ligase
VAGAHAVLRHGAGVNRTELAAHCGRSLAGYQIPTQCTLVDQVPRSAAGKDPTLAAGLQHENGAAQA